MDMSNEHWLSINPDADEAHVAKVHDILADLNVALYEAYQAGITIDILAHPTRRVVIPTDRGPSGRYDLPIPEYIIKRAARELTYMLDNRPTMTKRSA